MAQVIITINHREYAISCENGEEGHIIRLGNQLDEKARALTDALGHINENQLLAMVGLLIADELSEAKKELTTLKTSAATAPIQTSQVVTTPHIEEAPKTEASALSETKLLEIDSNIAEQINSLSSIIKSIAIELNRQ